MPPPCYRARRFCDSALPAADFVAALDRPSPSTAEAFFAAAVDVSFRGAPVWDNALPAAPFDFAAVAELRRTAEALDATFLLVSFDMSRLTVEVPNKNAMHVPRLNPEPAGVFTVKGGPEVPCRP